MKLGGIVLATAALLLAGSSAAPAAAPQRVEVEPVSVQVPASVISDMVADTRANLTELDGMSDAAIVATGYSACAAMLVQDKDAYREGLLAKYDTAEALDRLVIAAAAKQYLCA